MLKLAALLGVVGLGGLLAFERIEREMLYPFDTTRVAPESLGLDLREEMFESGGEELVLWVARAEPGKPVIVYFHGNAGNLANRAGRFELFRARGYGVVAMGYRGSSGSTGRPSERNLAFDAGRLLRRIGDYAEAPSVIYGESLGTAVALAALERSGVKPRALVLEAPFTSVRNVARHVEPKLGPLIDRMVNEWDSLGRIKRVNVPLLVLHGSRDTFIPIEMGRAVYAASPATDKRFIAVDGAGHTDIWRGDTLPALWSFIDARGR